MLMSEATYIYAWCLDLCLYLAVLRAFCALSQVPREQLNTSYCPIRMISLRCFLSFIAGRYFPCSTWTSNPFLFPVLKLRRILRKNYLQNSIFTQKPSRPPTTNLDSQQYTYYYKQARHNRITRFDCLLISFLPQIQPKQHIRHQFCKNPSVVLETSFEDPQQKKFTSWQPRT
jgi:hypothetical protein